MNNKIVVLGLDGATFDLLKPWMKEGHLPNLQRLIDEGCHGVLNSTNPPLSPVAWTSMVTGANPGKHGIFDFVERQGTQGYNIKFVNASSRRMEPIWSVLNKNGKKSVVINVPMSYPPDKIEHCVISGMDSPNNNKFIHPPELHKELKDKLGKYIIELDCPEGLRENVPKYMKRVKDALENRFEASEYLMKKYEWDFFMVVFTLTDRIQHYFWKYIDPHCPGYDAEKIQSMGNPIIEAAVMADTILGKLLEIAGKEATVVIVSDHGFGPAYKTFSINKWLISKGYMVTSKDREGIKKDRNAMKKLLSRFLPHQLKFALRKRLFKQKKLEFFQNLDWSKTTAYSEGASPRIFINTISKNLGGRIKDGEAYEALRDKLITDLMDIRDPETNNTIVKRVYKKEEIFAGNNTACAPDLMIEFKKGYTNYKKGNFRDQMIVGKGPSRDFLVRDPELSGDHLPNGIVVIRGPDIKRGIEIENAQITDIFPTILYLLNMPIPEDVDGKVLTQGIKTDFLTSHEITFLKCSEDKSVKSSPEVQYSNGEEEAIKKRLQELGYID